MQFTYIYTSECQANLIAIYGLNSENMQVEETKSGISFARTESECNILYITIINVIY